MRGRVEEARVRHDVRGRSERGGDRRGLREGEPEPQDAAAAKYGL